jgi:hypothetical protein
LRCAKGAADKSRAGPSGAEGRQRDTRAARLTSYGARPDNKIRIAGARRRRMDVGY